MCTFFTLFFTLLFAQYSFGQGTMGRWEMCSLSGTPASVTATGTLANVTFSTLTRGGGLTGASATAGFSSTGWSTSSSLDIAQNDYYEFTITPAAGYKMSITSLKIRDQVSSTSSSFDAYLRYSVDAYAANVVASWSPSTTLTNRTLTVSGVTALQNRTTPVTFRIYGTDAQNSTTTYLLNCQGTVAGNFRGVDVDGTVAQLAYASQFISMNTGSATWCAGETRNISVTVKNIGSATWADGGTPDVNIGVKWNTNGANWNDYYVRTDAGNLAPGATQTYNFTITASNATLGPVYGTALSAGTNNLTFDVVKEGDCWFGNNNGSCGPGNAVSVSVAQTIVANSTLSFTSAAGTNAQTKCAGTAITNITYLVGGGGTGATVTGLPTGVTGAYNSGTKVFTISGTPTVAGSYTYSVTTTGSSCTNPSLGGTINVTAASTISLVTPGTNIQTLCIGNAITDINYTYGGSSTGMSITAGALPAGLISGDDAGGNFTITGTPTATGTFNFTVTANGVCPVSLTGTITVNANTTLTFTSAAGTDAQTKCISTAITNITYLVGGGGTGASATGLPTGVTGSFNSGTKVFTISGTPSVAGTFTYTVNTAGPCVNTSLGGTITVVGNATISLTSGAGTNIQTKCANSAITTITYAIGGTGTGAFVTGLPAGITGLYSAGVFTISGAASAAVSGSFPYTVTTSGPCVTPNLTGTLTISPIPTTTGVTVCQGGSGSLTSSFVCASGAAVNTAATNATAGANVTGIGNTAWLNFGNVVSDNNSYATVALTSATAVSNYLRATGYSFAIPATATIGGIRLTIGRFSSNVSGSVRFRDNEVKLVKAGAIVGTNKANIGVDWPATEAAITYGTTTDLWGTTWTAADINNANFGAVLSGLNATTVGNTYTGSVDYMQITVTYTVPGSINWYTASSGGTFLGSGSPFNPVGVAGSTLANTNTVGTTTFYAECSTVAGCRTPTDFVIITSPTVSITGSTSICLSGSTTLSPSSGGTWASNSANATVDNSGIVTPVSAGSATFTFTDAGNGCPKTTAAVTILANSTISLSSAVATATQTKCINTAITNITYAIGGSGTGASVTGLPNGVTGSFNAGVFTISGAATETGSFSYLVTTAGPCVNTSLGGTITINPNATVTLTSATGTDVQTVCNNTAIAAISYTIGGGALGAGVTGLPAGVNGLFNAGVITISGTPTVAGTFNYTVTTTGTCAQATATGTITVNAPPFATFTTTNVSACGALPDGSIAVTASGGTGPYSYVWTGVTGSGNPATTQFPSPGNVASVSGLKIGFYNVKVIDAVGCEVSINNIHIQYAFAAYITNNGSISSACGNTGSIVLYANAGVQPYTFSLDGTSFSSNNTFTNLAAGTYTAYVKDGAGCIITKTIQVNAAAPIVVNSFVRGASSCSPDGSIEIYRTGGIPPYAYSLDGITYQVSNKFLNLAAGPYITYVKDSKGCTGQQAVTVTQGIALGVTVNKVNTSTCTNDGSIQVNPTGGFAPYSYSINGGSYQASNSFSGLAAGSYAISVKDFKGCLGAINVTINLNPIVVTSFVVNASSCASNNGSIHLFRTGGVGPYTYSLDGNTYQNGTTFTNLAPGEYDAYVKDSKTCIGYSFGIVVGPACAPPIAGGGTNTRIATNAVPGNAVKISTNSVLKISAYPNPSASSFMLLLEGNSSAKVTVIVTDLVGRKVYQAAGNVKQQYKFGNDLMPGIYMLQVIQGNEKQSLKLIKE